MFTYEISDLDLKDLELMRRCFVEMLLSKVVYDEDSFRLERFISSIDIFINDISK